ncbi:MAG: T9SS type A sorting domain-containing protein [Bacteroidales bacterium]|nr:T9SS type A sorting domain-containing protein [Bacteroidales bacterium]
MKTSVLILSVVLLLISLLARAGEGDTLIVQTIDFETPVLPGWNSPRSGKYLFPSDTASFSQILMYYTLKCDPNQNPACGEWDYTTHTKIWEHTGLLDSNLYFHPNYVVNNVSPDSFMLMNDTSFYYRASLEYTNQTTPTSIAAPGAGGQLFNLPFDAASPDGRAQFIYTAAELQAAGLQAGDITGIELNIESGQFDVDHFQIRMAHIEADTLPEDSLISYNLQTVFDKNTQLSTGTFGAGFAFPFTWNGSTNILLDLSYATHTGVATLEADLSTTGQSSVSSVPDYFLDFEGWDYLSVPAEVFQTVDSAITIAFWQYGNAVVQPINSSIFEGMDSAGNRILNSHLPWSNSRIYWDAGWNDGYDRIDRGAPSPAAFEGQWNYWVFTKDVRSGQMRMYLNGVLWNIGSSKYRPMNGITDFRIGSRAINNGYYAGMIDEFQIWDTVVEWDVIKQWMNKDITPDHPNYSHLRAYYKMNESGGFEVADSSPNGFDATALFGYPEWKNNRGANRFRNAVENTKRPHLVFQNGNYDAASLDSTVVVDTFSHAPVNIVFYGPDDPPTPIDTATRWPSYYNNYVYDAGGVATDSTLVTPDSTIYRIDMPYYGEPYEVIIPWEIGRFITPYGNGLSLGEGFTWVYDVTDYAPMLRDSVHITAGNFQELLDLKFYMIEGTPPRDVQKIEKVYSGYFNLNNFPALVPPDTVSLLPGASTFKIKTRTSGHLFSNPTNCAEFCYKTHNLLVNAVETRAWQIIRECSDNPLYPQGGTWIYDRAGWCPGLKVDEQDIEITGFITGDTAIIDYNSQADQYGAYSLEVQLFSYGAPNFTFDAAVDEVVAPNKLKRYGRFNPSASAPIVVIQNRGGEPLTELTITYGPQGTQKTFSWNGNLAFMEKETVELQAFDWEDWDVGNGKFTVEVSAPNGSVDENPGNDTYSTDYDLPVIYPGTFVIHFKTNKAAYQNRYEILTNTGFQIWEKKNFENQTLYVDTITLLNGAYDFYLWDSGDNGISFWANNEGNGYLKFYDLNGELIQNFNGDFGDRIYNSFYADMYLGNQEHVSSQLGFDILPNPNNGRFVVSYALEKEAEITLNIYSSSGQEISKRKVMGKRRGKLQIALADLPPGIYYCILSSGKNSLSKKFVVSR